MSLVVEKFPPVQEIHFERAQVESLPVSGILTALGLGFTLSLLFFMDQNISAAMVNAPQNRQVSKTTFVSTLVRISNSKQSPSMSNTQVEEAICLPLRPLCGGSTQRRPGTLWSAHDAWGPSALAAPCQESGRHRGARRGGPPARSVSTRL